MWRSIPIWLFVLTFSIRLIVLNRLVDSPYFLPDQGDMKFYSDWAREIAAGNLADGEAFYGLPGYAYLLGAFYAVVGFDAYLPALFQALSEAAIAVIILLTAREVFTGTEGKEKTAEGAGSLAALGWAFFLPAQTYSVVLMPTSYLVIAYWGIVLWVLRTRRDSIWRPWLWIGLVIGGMAMMIATILFLIPLVIAAIFLRGREIRGGDHRLEADATWHGLPVHGPGFKLLSVAVLMTGVVAGCSPVWVHNHFIAGEPVMLSAHSGVNFYVGNNPTATGYPKMPPGMRAGPAGMLRDSVTMAEKAVGRPLRNHEVSQYWKAKASQYIREHPGDWARLMAVKVRNVWHQFQYDDLGLVELFRQSKIVTTGIKFGLVAALALPAFFICARRFPRSRWIILAILLHLAALLPVFVTERYRLAAVPGLLLLASAALIEVWRWMVAGRWGAAGVYGLATFCAATLVSWPLNDPGLWALDYHNIGVKATRSGDLERAMASLERAREYVPDNAETLFGIANILLEKGDRAAAKALYRDIVELDPRHDGAWNNLGFLALDEGYAELAAMCFRKSLAVEPEDAKTWYLLAKAEHARGRRDEARDHIRNAIRLAPREELFREFSEKLKSES